MYIPLVENLLSKEQLHQEAQHMEPSQFLVLRHRYFEVQHNLYENKGIHYNYMTR